MRKFLVSFVFITIGFFALTGVARADEPVLDFFKDIEVHAFAASSYSFNTNRPADRLNQLRVFDTDDNSFKFDAGEFVLLKEAKKGGAGFRFDLSFGFSQPDVNKSAPDQNAGGVSVDREDFDVQQGYVTYNANIGSGLTIDAGKFITHVGTELMDGYDGFNYNISRSWGFKYGPFTHTGIRASYTINDQISVLAMLSNSWDTSVDDNDGKVWGTQVALSPWEGVSIYANWVGGLEQSFGLNDGWRDLFDIVIDIQLTDSTLLNIDILHGSRTDGVVAGNDANWWGFSGIIRQDINKWFSVSFRGEFFNDDDGIKTGTAQELASFTITPELRLTNNFVLRAEYRHDDSDALAFSDREGPNGSNTQNTLAVQGIFFF